MPTIPTERYNFASDSYPGETLDLWFSDPSKSFERWTARLSMKDSSRKVKRSMWNKFSRWMYENRVALDECTVKKIENFLEEEEITKEQRYRYIKLIDDVYAHLIFLGLPFDANPGTEAMAAGKARGQNALMCFFDQPARDAIASGLRAIYQEAKTSQERLEKISYLQKLRDAAMIGVQWGGGLRVSEVMNMTVNCTYEDGQLHIDAHDLIGAHRAELMDIGKEALEIWLPIRNRLNSRYGDDKLFPPDKKRRNHQVDYPPDRLHPANVYKRVRTLLNRFGVKGVRVSPQTLRNTFGAMRIEEGWNDILIMSSMGLRDEATMQRMRNEHSLWIHGLRPERRPPNYVPPLLREKDRQAILERRQPGSDGDFEDEVY